MKEIFQSASLTLFVIVIALLVTLIVTQSLIGLCRVLLDVMP